MLTVTHLTAYPIKSFIVVLQRNLTFLVMLLVDLKIREHFLISFGVQTLSTSPWHALRMDWCHGLHWKREVITRYVKKAKDQKVWVYVESEPPPHLLLC